MTQIGISESLGLMVPSRSTGSLVWAKIQERMKVGEAMEIACTAYLKMSYVLIKKVFFQVLLPERIQLPVTKALVRINNTRG
jgi:hypothetical protein